MNGQWTVSSTASSFGLDDLYLGTTGILPGLGWHPNCFGAGQGGVIVRGQGINAAYRPSDDTWHLINTITDPDLTGLTNGGASIYFDDDDTILIGTGHFDIGQPAYMMKFNAGANGNVDTNPVKINQQYQDPASSTIPPFIIGHAASTNYGHIMKDPLDSTNLVIMERDDPWRYWRSTNKGESWSLAGNHPAHSPNMVQYGSDTIAYFVPISIYGAIWVVHAYGNGGIGESFIWKPDI